MLGVEDVGGPTATGTRIDLRTAKGAIHSLVVGKPAGAREGYVRVAGAQASYLARPQLTVEALPGRWLDTTLIDVDPAQVRAVTLEPTGKPARTLEDAALQPVLAGALKGLALEDVRTRPLEPAESAATQRARFVSWDGLVIEVAGREDGPRRWITLAARLDPAAVRPRPAGVPPATGVAALQAKELAQRLDGHEFEIQSYRFANLFDLAPSP